MVVGVAAAVVDGVVGNGVVGNGVLGGAGLVGIAGADIGVAEGVAAVSSSARGANAVDAADAAVLGSSLTTRSGSGLPCS